MIRKGKALIKATTSVPTGSTTGNPGSPLNDTYFDTVCQHNAGKLVGRGIVCERPLKFPDAIPDLLDPITPEHESPSAERSEDFMDAEGGEDEDQDSEGGVDEAEYAPYRRATKPKEHPADSTDTASED
ncbi:hypothetical protein PIB30_102145 [Stylosanthes scabra]|uniref:Uncharacterized protein n=1 Tax=Stylosanthes scabra TaxID=79078 RepID=A0ABU6XWT8_9FABA|nr:hypothetical protein [Stylosanthes scabra]